MYQKKKDALMFFNPATSKKAIEQRKEDARRCELDEILGFRESKAEIVDKVDLDLSSSSGESE